MAQRSKHAHLALAAILVGVTLAACGGGSTSPSSSNNGSNNGSGGSGGSGGGSSNCSVTVSALGCPKGLVRATFDGQPFNGGVTNGGSVYTPVAAIPSLNLPAQDFINMVGVTSTNAQISLVTRAKVRTSAVGLNVLDPDIPTPAVSVNSIMVIVPNGAPVAPGWVCSVAGGSGTITVSTVSTTAATGSFSCTLIPIAGSPATGNRQVSGTFDVTF